MQKIILVAGATGNLGLKTVQCLIEKGAHVKALVREETSLENIALLQKLGVETIKINNWNEAEITAHCIGAHCVLSTLSGLENVVLDTQKILLQAAVMAKVQRFIPSDFCIDFTNLIPGKNRNLDFRRAFEEYINNAPIKATSIFNGAFMDLLTTDMPLILASKKRILCWGNPNQKMEFTHTLNVAAFTANVALDIDTPRYMHIAGDFLSCNDFLNQVSKLYKQPFKLFRPGGIGLFNFMIKLTRFFSPGKNELYPPWQGMQYMRDMMEGRVKADKWDNNKYQDVKWINVTDFLHSQLSK